MINYSHKFAVKKNEELLPNEEACDAKLNQDKYYVIRFDGVHMTKNFLGKPEYKPQFINVMRRTIELFMKNTEQYFCYSYSDEISVLLEKEVLEKYEYRLEKILSVYTSKITCAFIYAAYELNFDLGDTLRAFDGRLIELSDVNEVKNYFICRQTFCISCLLLRLKSQHFPSLNTTKSEIIIDCLEKKGIIYTQIPNVERYGLLWIRKAFLTSYEFIEYHKRLYQQIMNRKTFEVQRKRKEYIKRS